MARTQGTCVAATVAFFAAGLALAVAQGPGADRPSPARPARPAPARQRAPMDMKRLLKSWEAQSAKLKTLEVRIYRVDKSLAWGEEEHFQGRAAFRSPRQALLEFRKVALQAQPDPNAPRKKVLVPVQRNGQIASEPYEKMVCTTDEVWDYRYDVKQVYIFPLDGQQRTRALEEGPLRFLFNLKADETDRRYDMVLQREDKAGYLIKVNPLLEDDRSNFKTAWIYLDKDFLLPFEIGLVAADGKSTQNFRLTDIRANEPMDPRLFDVGDPGKEWKLERNPGGDPPAPDARARRRLLDNKAARRAPAADLNQPR